MQDLSLPQLRDELKRIEESLDELPGFVPCLKELAALPAAARQCLAAIAARRRPAGGGDRAPDALDELLPADPPLTPLQQRQVQARHVAQAGTASRPMARASAATVRDRVCRRFLEHVRIASLPHAQLTAEQKEFKTRLQSRPARAGARVRQDDALPVDPRSGGRRTGLVLKT